MRIFPLLVIILQGANASASAVASDLAFMAHGHETHPATTINSKSSTQTVKSTNEKSMLLHSNELGKSESISVVSIDQPDEVLSLWRVRILLGVLIVSMIVALGIAVIHTGRVFGLFPEAGLSVIAASSPKSEADPESLTRLLSSQTSEGFGAILATRGYVTAFSTPYEEKPKIVIQ